jgi:hypothetical protein
LTRRSPASSVDRIAAVNLGRFFVGWLLAILLLTVYVHFQPSPWRASWDFVDRREEPTLLFLACLLGGGVAMILFGRLTQRGHRRLYQWVSGLVVYATLFSWLWW